MQLPKNFPSNLSLRFVENSRIRGVKMMFDGQGSLVLKKHKRISKKYCLEFLNANMEWVLSHFNAMQNFKIYKDKMYFFGEWREFDAVLLELEEIKFLDEVFKFRQKKLIDVESKKDSKEALIYLLQKLWSNAVGTGDLKCKKTLEIFYRKILESYVSKRIEIISKMMNLYPSSVEFGKSYRQLGCCHAKTQKIRFSLRLSLMPKNCIDSVIIHELAHLKCQNHSRDFWHFVNKFDTDPKQAQLWLGEHKENLQIYYKVFKF